MRWKMSERSLFALLLRSPWWVSFLLAGAISLAAAALLPDAYKIAGLLCSFPFVVIGLLAAWRQRNVVSAEQALALHQTLAKMHWRDFLPLITKSFIQQGYTVTLLNHSLADFSIHQKGQTTLVCAKRWKAAAWGMDHLQALVAQREEHQAIRLVCVSLQSLPKSLQSFTIQNRIDWLSDQALWALVAPVIYQLPQSK
jgi:restriction system protein